MANSYYGYVFESEHIDSYLFKVMMLFLTNLIELKKIEKELLIVEEYRIMASPESFPTFFYVIENKKLGLSGYMGREKDGKVTYLIMDHSRFSYAEKEGFDFTREQVINELGVFRKLATITDFIKFMGGEKSYEFKGGYILGKDFQRGS